MIGADERTFIATYADLLFVVAHLILVAVRTASLNRYGPCALLFVSLFDAFFAVPIYFDFLVGTPSYESLEGIGAATTSDPVNVLYDVIVLLIATTFAVLLRQDRPIPVVSSPLRARGTVALMTLAYLPAIYVVASGHFSDYRTYGAVLTSYEILTGTFHTVVVFLIGVSVIATGLLFLALPRTTPQLPVTLALLAPAVGADVWLMGKRSIIAFLALIIALALLAHYRHRLRPRHAVAGVALIAAPLLFSRLYQAALRPDTQFDVTAAYENYRIDMGRDHGLKLAIHNELTDLTPPILEYRMQSLLFIATLPVPRSVWPEKPWPYAVYATSAALGSPIRDWGWGLTTDIFSELIANLGLLGLIPACWFLVWAIRRVDRASDPTTLLLGTLSLCSLLVLQFAAVSIWHLTLLAYLAFRWLSPRRLPAPARVGPPLDPGSQPTGARQST